MGFCIGTVFTGKYGVYISHEFIVWLIATDVLYGLLAASHF